MAMQHAYLMCVVNFLMLSEFSCHIHQMNQFYHSLNSNENGKCYRTQTMVHCCSYVKHLVLLLLCGFGDHITICACVCVSVPFLFIELFHAYINPKPIGLNDGTLLAENNNALHVNNDIRTR